MQMRDPALRQPPVMLMVAKECPLPTFPVAGGTHFLLYKHPWYLELLLMTSSGDSGYSLMTMWSICFPSCSVVCTGAAFPPGLSMTLSHETFLIIWCDIYHAWMSVTILTCYFFKEANQVTLLICQHSKLLKKSPSPVRSSSALLE